MWTPCGFHIDTTWFPCGHYLVSMWMSHSFHIDTIWFPHGHMDTMQCGHHMVSTWIPCGVQETPQKQLCMKPTGFLVDKRMGFSAFDLLWLWAPFKMVYNGFWHFPSYLPLVSTTAVPGKYQWGCLPLSLSFASTQYLVTQTNPITVLPLLLKGPQALTYALLPPTLKSTLEAK